MNTEQDLNVQLQQSLTILSTIAAKNNRNAMRIIREVEHEEKKLYCRWKVLGFLSR